MKPFFFKIGCWPFCDYIYLYISQLLQSYIFYIKKKHFRTKIKSMIWRLMNNELVSFKVYPYWLKFIISIKLSAFLWIAKMKSLLPGS